MHWTLRALLAAALTLAVYGLGVWTPRDYWGFFPRPDPNGADPPPFNPAGSGRIQPRDGVLSVGGVPGDRIKAIFVKVNDPVKKGQVLVEFASHDERQREVDLATRQLAHAEVQLRAMGDAEQKKVAEAQQRAVMARRATELKIRLDKLQLPVAQEGLKYATDTLSSLRSLDPARATVALQDMQKMVVEAASARAKHDTAAASLEANRLQLELEKKGERAATDAIRAEFEVSRAALQLPVLEEQVKLAKLRLDRALIKAESDGTVLRVLGRPGGAVGQEPILQLTTSAEMSVIAEVYVDSINTLYGWLGEGKTVSATMSSPALRTELRGTVRPDAVAHTVARNALTGFGPRADTDRRVIEVPIDLDEKSSKAAARFVGLEVDVKFLDPSGKDGK